MNTTVKTIVKNNSSMIFTNLYFIVQRSINIPNFGILMLLNFIKFKILKMRN